MAVFFPPGFLQLGRGFSAKNISSKYSTHKTDQTMCSVLDSINIIIENIFSLNMKYEASIDY